MKKVYISLVIAVFGISCSNKVLKPIHTISSIDHKIESMDVDMNDLSDFIVFKSIILTKPSNQKEFSYKLKDSSLVITINEKQTIHVFEHDTDFVINLLRKQAESSPEVKYFVNEIGFKNDFELYEFILSNEKVKSSTHTSIIYDIKETILPVDSDLGVYKLISKNFRGFQFCTGKKCSANIVEVYIGGSCYQLIFSGMDQNEIDSFLGTMGIKSLTKDLTNKENT